MALISSVLPVALFLAVMSLQSLVALWCRSKAKKDAKEQEKLKDQQKLKESSRAFQVR
jgi:hypothetical protein